MSAIWLVQSLLLFSYVPTCFAIRCMECSHTQHPSDCETMTACPGDSECYIEEYVTTGGLTQYNQGCKVKQQCASITGRRSSPFRKRGSTNETRVSKRGDITICIDCCATDFCNQEGCGVVGTSAPNRGPWCFDCTKQSGQDTCRTIKQCQTDDVCALTKGNLYDGEFTTACISKLQCDAIHVRTSTIVQPKSSIIGKRSYTLPVCCDWDFCNDHSNLVNMTGGPQANSGDGQWSEWGNWSACSQTCGTGSVHRTRLCDNPPPSATGNYCLGNSTQEVSCGIEPCNPVDVQWSAWGACNPTCGTGRIHSRQKPCDNLTLVANGGNCTGNITDQKSCVDIPCPVDGKWSQWGNFSACNPTCGTGRTKRRQRSCDNPAPSLNGTDCYGLPFEQIDCPDVQCQVSVDGQWSNWGNYSACTPTCGIGRTKSRLRTCDNPTPSLNGRNCTGQAIEQTNCSDVQCPVDGTWSDWGQWASCTVSCGNNGWHIRNRACNGTHCQGSRTDVKACHGLSACQIDGQWSPWTEWTTCTVTCGKGNKVRTRLCDDPAPQNNGQLCNGTDMAVEHCNIHECPVDGQWSPWTGWSSCTASCGDGDKLRTRSCDDPPPQHNGQLCIGSNMDLDLCNLITCPIDGQWSPWTDWSDCSASCGTGGRFRARYCDDPKPQYNGQPCSGQDTDAGACNTFPCPVDGQWSAWSPWSTCEASCGTNVVKARMRNCDNPAPQYNGHDCPGDFYGTEQCHVNPCIGIWMDWTHWTSCTATCGPLSRRIRTRLCDNPSHGLPCPGLDEEIDHCHAPDC